LYKKR